MFRSQPKKQDSDKEGEEEDDGVQWLYPWYCQN